MSTIFHLFYIIKISLPKFCTCSLQSTILKLQMCFSLYTLALEIVFMKSNSKYYIALINVMAPYLMIWGGKRIKKKKREKAHYIWLSPNLSYPVAYLRFDHEIIWENVVFFIIIPLLFKVFSILNFWHKHNFKNVHQIHQLVYTY